MEEVAPIYFTKLSKIASLYRQLNAWGFKRVGDTRVRKLNTWGYELVGKTHQKSSAWKHILFCRDEPELMQFMERLKVKNVRQFDQQAKSRRVSRLIATAPATSDATCDAKNKKVGDASMKTPKKKCAGTESGVETACDGTNNEFTSQSLGMITHIEHLLAKNFGNKLHVEGKNECRMPTSDTNYLLNHLGSAIKTTTPQPIVEGNFRSKLLEDFIPKGSTKLLNNKIHVNEKNHRSSLAADTNAMPNNGNHCDVPGNFNIIGIDLGADLASVFD